MPQTPPKPSLQKITEQSGQHRNLEQKSIGELLQAINQEDKTVAYAVEKALSQVEALAQCIVQQMQQGGRLFYIGAGTSGRLGVVDASEIPPTFGAPPEWVVGIIAGGDTAIRKSVEFAEDNALGGWHDLQQHKINTKDVVVGIAASGTTPYVVGAVKQCNAHGIATGCICCNPGSPLAAAAQHPIEVIVGPEFVRGSTRMKSGTAQKMVLNMLSTVAMIQLGRIQDNRMVDMQIANNKLAQRGAQMLAEQLNISQQEAAKLLQQHTSVRAAIMAYNKAQ